MFSTLFQNLQLDNIFVTHKIPRFVLLLLLIIASLLFSGCGLQNDEPNINNVMGAMNQYERQIQQDIFQLHNSNRLIPASPDIRDMTWLLVWDIGGDISIETSTGRENKTYNFSDAIKRNGTYILAAQSDLSNPESLPDNETFRILEVQHSLQEITGRILRADKQMMILIKDALISQTAFIENTAPTEAFFRLNFARATHSYSIITSNSQQARMMTDQLLQGRQAYVFISNLYWAGIGANTSISLPGGIDFSLNGNNSPIGLSRNVPTPFPSRHTNSHLNSPIQGKVDVSIDLVSLTDVEHDNRIINIFFQQTAIDFQNPGQVQGVNVILTTDSNDQNISDFGSIHLRRKNLNPLHFAFQISAAQLASSIEIISNISNLVSINPFEDVGIQSGLISEIGVRKDRNILGKILNPSNWAKGVGRLFRR